MEIDPNLVLCLVNIQQLGGESVPLKHGVLKALAESLESAVANGFASKSKIPQLSIGKNGKPKNSKIDVVSLTAAGIDCLRREADPLFRDKVAAAHLRTFAASLETGRQQLLTDLRDEALTKSDTSSSVKSLAEIRKALSVLETKITTFEKVLESRKDDSTRKIDAAFANLLSRLLPFSSEGIDRTPQLTPSRTLEGLLKDAYDQLCRLVEYQDRLVPLFRLYHQARHMDASFTIGEFHAELLRLWDKRTLELQSLNEVRSAIEPDKAIRRNESLYYFVLWH